jgi:hypothetical protein
MRGCENGSDDDVTRATTPSGVVQVVRALVQVQRVPRLDRLSQRKLACVVGQELEVVERGENLERHRLGVGLPLLERDETRDRLRLLVEARGQLREPARTLLERRAAPDLRRERRRLDRLVDLRRVGASDPGEGLAGRRVHVGDPGAGAGPGSPFTRGSRGSGPPRTPALSRFSTFENIGAAAKESRSPLTGSIPRVESQTTV